MSALPHIGVSDFTALGEALHAMAGPAAYQSKALLKMAIETGEDLASLDLSAGKRIELAHLHAALAVQMALVLTLDDIADTLNHLRINQGIS